MSFRDFVLDPRCFNILQSQGIETPTPVQAQSIPIVLAGHDLIATAQTGTGKTLGFALPALTRLTACAHEPNLMLVLVPTRELAVQVHSVIREFGAAMKIRSAAVYGGVGMGPQTDALRRGCGVVVATPGRLLDHLQQGTVNFKNLKILVLDEADRMLDMGFIPDIRRIVRQLPAKRQTLMFSATFADEVASLAREMLIEPKRVSIGLSTRPVETVRQVVYTAKHEDKSTLLLDILRRENPSSALVFTRTKHRADRVGRTLKSQGHTTAVIHGNRSQGQRQSALTGFKEGTYRILVATDVAARGLDITGISHVINFDIPDGADSYIHRIGRTGRASATGDAITLVTPEDRGTLHDIEKRIGKSLPKAAWARSADLNAPQPKVEAKHKPHHQPVPAAAGQSRKKRKHPNPYQFSANWSSPRNAGGSGSHNFRRNTNRQTAHAAGAR